MAIIPQNVYYGIKTKYLNKFKIDYQGTVATVSNLPEGDIPKGTIYNVEANGSNYLWNGEEWDNLGISDANVVHKTGEETVTGEKTFTAQTTICDTVFETGGKIGFKNKISLSTDGQINKNKSDSNFLIVCGSSITNSPYIEMRGAEASSNPGTFLIRARNSTTYKDLAGSPDGTLKWNGQAIQTTSDERLKTSIKVIPDVVLDAWEEVQWGQFKYLDAVEHKGESARLHLGLIAQKVKAIFEQHNLNACEYGILCYEEEENLWMVRYTEALAMEAACQKRRADKLEMRIAILEEKLK